MIADNDLAPDFELPGDDGATHTLAAHRGHPVIVYFYPKDNTSGCTTEACDFRDNMERLQGHGAVVYGISKDSLKSHDRFREKHDLNFVLLSDEDTTVHQAYDAWGEKKNYGRVYQGVIRSTFLIDAEGTLVKVWRKVRVKGHVDKVMAELEALAGRQ